MTPKFGRNNSLPTGALMLPQNQAIVLKRFAVQDTYQIKERGDYTLTVWPVIYQFSTNRQFLTRIDLPYVTTKIHLEPQEE
jgi:hypothetical protein